MYVCRSVCSTDSNSSSGSFKEDLVLGIEAHTGGLGMPFGGLPREAPFHR